MEIDIQPLHGVGPLRLDMHSPQVQEALATWGTPEQVSLSSWSVELPGGTRITTSSHHGEVYAIDIDTPGTDQVTCYGVDVFRTPYQDVLAAVSRHATIDSSTPGWFRVPEIGLTFRLGDTTFTKIVIQYGSS